MTTNYRGKPSEAADVAEEAALEENRPQETARYYGLLAALDRAAEASVWGSVYAAVWAGDLAKHGHGVAEYAARMADQAVADLRALAELDAQ